MPRRYEPSAHVLAANGADCNCSLPTVHVALPARYRRARDPICQGESCHLTAAIFYPIGSLAKLAALRRVDTVQADALTVDIQSVAVNYGRLPHERRCNRGRTKDMHACSRYNHESYARPTPAIARPRPHFRYH
nr:hypothetical protein [Ancylobacter aquaticus]